MHTYEYYVTKFSKLSYTFKKENEENYRSDILKKNNSKWMLF